MATYYVRTDGNDSNAGTGPATNQAWQTIGKALGASGIGSGDTLYIAPGDYRQTATITVGGTYSAPTYVIGDPTGSQFSGITPGRVLITNRLSNDVGNSAGTFALFTLASKDYLQFSNFVFEQAANQHIFSVTDSVELQWHKCLFQNAISSPTFNIVDTTTNGLTKNYIIRQCIAANVGNAAFYSDATIGKSGATQNFVYNVTFDRCYMQTITLTNSGNATFSGTGFYIYNCVNIGLSVANLKDNLVIKNTTGAPGATWSVTGSLGAGGTGVVSNCSCYATSGFSGYTITNLRTAKYTPYNTGIQRLWGLPQVDWWTTDGLYTYATGDTSGTPVVDFYDVAWEGGAPNIGAYNNYTTTLTGQYNPTERNTSAITIVPNSTSQSIELYLGVTGLVFNTSGLSAHYIRNRSSPEQISLVSQTATGSWVSGGFAEISSSNAPGLYRLDVPNAAFASGADDVTIVVRGAAGSNGAVITCTLFNPTANLLNTQAGIYTASGTLGARLLQTVSDNRPVIVTSANQIQVDAGQTFSSGSGTTILDPILNSVGRWTLEGNTLTLYNADGTYLRRCNLSQLGLSLSPT